MMSFLRNARDSFFGRGAAAVTVPPMDGALKPNRDLEKGEVLARIAQPDSLANCAGMVLCASGATLLRLDTGGLVPVHEFAAPISALAADGTGRLAVGLADGTVLIGRLDAIAAMQTVAASALTCPVAMAFDEQGNLAVCQGSSVHQPQDWARDLMERRASGALWRIAAGSTQAERVVGNLAYPFGVVPVAGGYIVNESWRHRLLRIEAHGARSPVLDDLPGYPARLSVADDGYLLSIFAPRSQLIEFVLRERRFRERMLSEVDPRHWIAPARSSARHYLDPMQGGGMITHGQVKPWAPTRSYGLVVRLDAAMQPVASHHSRADGRFHGVTDCLELGGDLLVASHGGDAVLRLVGAGRAAA